MDLVHQAGPQTRQKNTRQDKTLRSLTRKSPQLARTGPQPAKKKLGEYE